MGDARAQQEAVCLILNYYCHLEQLLQNTPKAQHARATGFLLANATFYCLIFSLFC